MSEGKSDDNDRIWRKIREIENELRRKRRHSNKEYNSDDSESSATSHYSKQRSPNYQEAEMLDDSDEEVTQDLAPPEIQDDASSQSVCETKPDPIPGPSGTVPLLSVVVIPKNTATSLDNAVSNPLPTEELDRELLDILGTVSTFDKTYGKDIQKDLASRLQHWTTEGLKKDLRKELKDKYLTPANCNLIDAPQLNAEIKAAVSHHVAKRDKALLEKQQHVTSAIACLGQAITLLFAEKEKNTNMIKILTDAARIMSDCHYNYSMTRKKKLLGAVKEEVRDQLKNTKIDNFLFGDKLAETLKSAKAITKFGSDLKVAAPKVPKRQPKQNTAHSSKLNLNWKGQGPYRRQTEPLRTKEPVAAATHGRPANSSKTSQLPQQQPTYNRR